METIGLQEGLELKEISPDVYESVQRPWTWPGSSVIPGGILMGLGAAAAYKTVSSDFSIDTLQAHFVSGAKAEIPLQQKVQRLSDGGRFVTRVVTVEQKGKVMVHITCSFVRTLAMDGASMQHTVTRATSQTVEAITLDDLVPKGKQGPYMKFQRLPLVYTGPGKTPEKPPPESLIYTSVASISPSLDTDERQPHALGLIALSDYHVLDCPPTVHGLTVGLPHIGDTTRTPTHADMQRLTSLNHTIRFHVHDGFRADDLCYIETMSPWANRRRAEVQTRIFDPKGKLIATCVQGGYYVLKDPKAEGKL